MMHVLWKSNDRFRLLVAAMLLGSVGSASADVQLPNVFSDSMVLQRGQKNRVWGHAEAGEKVTVTIADQSHQAAADADGNWQIMLSPLSTGDPLELIRSREIMKSSLAMCWLVKSGSVRASQIWR